MTDKTAAERNRRLYAKRSAEYRKLGLVRRALWSHPEDWPAIRKLAERLADARKRAGVRE